jgi:hypothetical protein
MRFLPYPYQTDFLLDRSPARIVLKARQTGMSQAVAIEALHRAAYQPGRTILLVSKDLDAAVNLLRYVKACLPLSEPAVFAVKENETELILNNRSRLKSVSASPKTGRSFAASHVYLDEFAFEQYALQIYQSVSPTISRGGTITVLSTPYGERNPFYQLWSGQIGDASAWSRHVIPWYHCPEWAGDPAQRERSPWYQRERPKYTGAQWASEYDCDFEKSGVTPFQTADIEAATDGWAGLKPSQPGRRYVTGWDIGRRQDATVGVTLDVTTDVHQVVAFDRFERMPFPQIQVMIEHRSRDYPGRTFVESNGIGDPVIENLTVAVSPFVTTAKTKVQALTSLIRAHERHTIKYGVDRLRQELLSYQWDDDAIVQDCVMALAITEHESRNVRTFTTAVSGPRMVAGAIAR